jgi:hypothetical protein
MFDIGRQGVHRRDFKLSLLVYNPARTVSENHYIFYTCIQGEAWTGAN